jgi:hypothetical protein
MVMPRQDVWVNGRPVTVPSGVFRTGDGPRVVVRFNVPVDTRLRSTLEASGGTVAFWCPPDGGCLTAPGPAADRLAGLTEVAGFVPYEQRHCDRGLRRPRRGPGTRWLDVICFSSHERDRVAGDLERLGASVLDAAHAKLRVDWPGDPAPVRDVVGVKLVERPRVARLSRVGLAVDVGDAGTDGTWLSDLDGTGQTLAFADTGLDTGDPKTVIPDLAGRVRTIVSLPINPSWSGFVTNPGADDGPADTSSGHGTYVVGVATGDGTASGGTRRGVAPKARVVMQAIEQFVAVAPGHPEIGASGFMLAGRPTDLQELFLRARELGARVHVNAWGTPAHGAYDNDAYETDLFLSEHRDAVVLFAAGNEGSDRDGNRRTDAASLDSPASAKNVIAVGATEGSEQVGFFGAWAQLQTEGRVFANTADRNDAVAGQSDRIAPLSSAGPTNDGRIKPDVCAPGTDIVGTRSSLATGRGWGLVDPAPHYMVDGGTSVAVAVAGGCTALLRQAWSAAKHGHAPAGATLKALLVLGAAPLRTRDGTGLEDRAVAGFGRIDVRGCLPVTGDGERVLVLSDSTARTAVTTGSARRYRVALPTGGRMRAVLAWYDAPGERLVNDLDLSLTGPGITTPVWGNHTPGNPSRPGAPDRVNTVEVVDLDGLAAGTFELAVAGAQIPTGRQPFSLVVRGRGIRRT